MRLLKILQSNETSVPIKAKSPSHMLSTLPLALVLAPSVALAQHDGGRMGGGGGWMGGGGWTDTGGMWLWTVVAILVIVLLVVLITKQARQK